MYTAILTPIEQTIATALQDGSVEWMSILNSSAPLSNDIIAMFAESIDWSSLTRQLPESIINRFHRNVINWTDQLYGAPRTIEFLTTYKNKFDWSKISEHPPTWFTECHAEIFDSLIDWRLHTPYAITYSFNTISMYALSLDWTWISTRNIPCEEFANRFLIYIEWDNANLDISNISTEFLYKLYQERLHNYNIKNKIDSHHRLTAFSMIVKSLPIKTFQPRDKIAIGGSITLMFFRKHFDDIDIETLRERKMITAEMQEVIDNM